jgi:Ca2+-binding RTX toxin-like protein
LTGVVVTEHECTRRGGALGTGGGFASPPAGG